MKLHTIQAKINVPKKRRNTFGNYDYRSCEDIVEAAKPVLSAHGFHLLLTDEVVSVGNRVYIKATATITDGTETYEATGWAREEEVKKGMDAAQITGSASSYARKYALNGLFAIDDTKDPDATNTHGKDERPVKKMATEADFVKVLQRVRKEGQKAYDAAKEYFTFTTQQYTELVTALKQTA